MVYRAQGRYEDAEALQKRSLAVYEKSLGQEHPLVGTSASNLAQFYWEQRRYAEAEPLYRRALRIREKGLGPEHPDVSRSLHDLALLYDTQGRYAEAQPLYKRSLTIAEKALGPNHRDISDTLNNLAGLYALQDRHADAEFYYQRSLAIRETALGSDHPDVGISLANLGWLFFGQHDWAMATDYWRRSTDLVIRRSKIAPGGMGEALAGKTKSETERTSNRFRNLVRASHRFAAPAGADQSGNRWPHVHDGPVGVDLERRHIARTDGRAPGQGRWGARPHRARAAGPDRRMAGARQTTDRGRLETTRVAQCRSWAGAARAARRHRHTHCRDRRGADQRLPGLHGVCQP